MLLPSGEERKHGYVSQDHIVKGSKTVADKFNAHGYVNPDYIIKGNKIRFDHTVGDGSGAVDPNQTGKVKFGIKSAGKLNGNQFDNGKLKGKGLGGPASMQSK